MPRQDLINSGYIAMWLLVMFDLPVVEKEDRKKAAKFRNVLLDDGFSMLQFSVYGRYCPSEAASKVHRDLIVSSLPTSGQVRILSITEKQFAKMENFIGTLPCPPEDTFEQLTFW